MPNIKGSCASLNNGHLMPLLGLGTWQSPANTVKTAVQTALDNGYRHIDTAYVYFNEGSIGEAVFDWTRKSPDNQRNDIFITTKLPMIGLHSGGPKAFLTSSLKKLKLSYVDLYLIHGPVGLKGRNDQDGFPMAEDGTVLTDPSTDLIAIWKEMENLVREGLTKSIGVSNFNVRQMTKINAVAMIQPAVNQVELHVNFQQKDIVEYATKSNILITAYGPLGSPGNMATSTTPFPTSVQTSSILDNPVVKLVAANHKVTTAQVLIKFLLQQGIAAVPKSVNMNRIKSNGDVFSFQLAKTEMESLMLLDKGESGRLFNFLGLKGAKEHPECPLQSY